MVGMYVLRTPRSTHPPLLLPHKKRWSRRYVMAIYIRSGILLHDTSDTSTPFLCRKIPFTSLKDCPSTACQLCGGGNRARDLCLHHHRISIPLDRVILLSFEDGGKGARKCQMVLQQEGLRFHYSSRGKFHHRGYLRAPKQHFLWGISHPGEPVVLHTWIADICGCISLTFSCPFVNLLSPGWILGGRVWNRPRWQWQGKSRQRDRSRRRPMLWPTQSKAQHSSPRWQRSPHQNGRQRTRKAEGTVLAWFP